MEIRKSLEFVLKIPSKHFQYYRKIIFQIFSVPSINAKNEIKKNLAIWKLFLILPKIFQTFE